MTELPLSFIPCHSCGEMAPLVAVECPACGAPHPRHVEPVPAGPLHCVHCGDEDGPWAPTADGLICEGCLERAA